MGTTLTALLFHGRRAYLGHVGDSRAYLYRDGHARQLTEDHSWIQDQVRAGLLTTNEAQRVALPEHHHPLGRASNRWSSPTCGRCPQAGDCFLLLRRPVQLRVGRGDRPDLTAFLPRRPAV